MEASAVGEVRVLGLREGALPRLAPLRGLVDLRGPPLVSPLVPLVPVPITFFFFFMASFEEEFMEIILLLLFIVFLLLCVCVFFS